MALDLDIDGIDQDLLRRGVHPEVIAALSGAQPPTKPASSALSFAQPSQPNKPMGFMGPKPEPAAPDIQANQPTGNALSFVRNGQPAQPASIGNPAPAGNPADPMNKGAQPVSFAKRIQDEEARGQAIAATPAPQLHGWKKWLDIAGQVAAPGIESRIQGTPGNFAAAQRGALARSNARVEGIKTEESAANVESEIRERDNKPDPRLPEAEQAIADHLAATNRPDTPQNRDAARGELAERNKTAGQADKTDKKIDEYVGADGKRVEVMQRQDNTTYEVKRGAVRAEAGTAGATDVKDLAQGIIGGIDPPDLKTYGYRDRTALAAELKRQGFNLTRAEQDWTATQKYLSTLNGAQQTRLRQAVSFTKDGLDQLEDIYNQWQRVGATSGWKTFNKASLATAKQLPGAAGELAHRLEARMADVTSELGTVYKGGNSSTDESLKLAAKNLSGDWNEQTFKGALKDIRESIRYRENSMKLVPAGASAGNAYTPPTTKSDDGKTPTWNPKTGRYE